MTAPLVHTSALTKDYGKHRALSEMSLDIPRGEIFGLLGPNGSGKSTALRMLLGFLRPTGGKATIADFDCWSQSVDVRRRVAYLPGELRLYESMTGRQLIAFLENICRQEFVVDPNVLAKRLDIDLDRPLVQMSSGMKRKVALITVLLPKVDLIILDEPTNTLDPTMRDQLLQQLREAKARSQTVLFSSHVLHEVEAVCDRVGILQQGKLVHLQDMRQLTTRRVHVHFVETPKRWPDYVPTNLREDIRNLSFEYDGSMPMLLQWLSQEKVADLRIESAGLNSIYQRYHGVQS